MGCLWRWAVLGIWLAGGVALAGEWRGVFSWTPDQVGYEEQDGFERIRLAGGELPEDEPGTPWVPSRFIQVLLPAGVRAETVTVAVEETRLRTGMRVLPVQPPQRLSAPLAAATPPQDEAYRSTQRYPGRSAELLGTHHLRGFTLASVRLNPLGYLPATGELFLVTRMEVVIEYTPEAPADGGLPPAPMFADLVAGLVVNPEDLPAAAGDEAAGGGVDYLIITSAALSNSFQALAAHRGGHNGLAARVVTTEDIAATYDGTKPSGGSDLQTKIRQCIAAHVQTGGTVYVVLGGDNTVVPDRDCRVTCGSDTANDMPTDLYYGGLDGTWDANTNGVYGEPIADAGTEEADMAVDVIVARIPVRTAAQADGYIGKLIRYETEWPPAGLPRKLLLDGTQLWTSHTGDERPADLVGDGLSEFRAHSPVSDAEVWLRRMWRDQLSTNAPELTVRQLHDTLTSWDGATAGDYVQSAANLAARLNEGWNHVYVGTHGGNTVWGMESGSFGTGAAAGLSNWTVHVYTMACLTGAFDTAEPSLSEAFVRNAAGGALAYMGCSRYGWGSPGSYRGGPSMDYAYEFYRQVYERRRETVGEAFVEHKLAKISACGYKGANRWVQFGLNLQGEPLVALRRADLVLGDEPFWFRAVALDGRVVLRWPDPHTCGLSNQTVLIRHGLGAYPGHTNDGTRVYQGTDQMMIHSNRPAGQPNYYTVWVSHDGATFIEPP